jgi:hypothetical protein
MHLSKGSYTVKRIQLEFSNSIPDFHAVCFAFALWMLGSTGWHAIYGTMPKAEVMGIVGIAALGMRICVLSGFLFPK